MTPHTLFFITTLFGHAPHPEQASAQSGEG